MGEYFEGRKELMPSPRIKNNLNDFKSQFKTIVKPTLYEATIYGDGWTKAKELSGAQQLGPVASEADRTFIVNCEVAALPGEALSTQPNRIYGPVREMVYEKLFSGDLQLTFRMDGRMWLRQVFSAWQSFIQSKESGDFEYYKNFISNIELYQYPTTQAQPAANEGPMQPTEGLDKPIYGVRINEVYPKSVGAIELGYEQRDTYMKQTVDFAYRSWEEIPTDEL